MSSKQTLTGEQVRDHSLTLDDIDITTPGKALITKVHAGPGLEIVGSTGVDEGTGEVTLGTTQLNQFRFDIPTTNMTGFGFVAPIEVVSNSIGIGGCLCINYSTKQVVEASALDENLIPAIGIALESGTGQKDVLIQGTFRNNAWAWTPYATIYVSTASGLITQTRPDGLGENVQELGFALTATTILFNPDKTYFKL